MLLKEKGKRILVVQSHVDDGQHGCGGAILKFLGLGYRVKVICTTNHERKAVPALMKAYGIEEYEVYNFGYQSLRLHEIELIKKLLEDINAFEPDIVFTEFPRDFQVDHEVTARAATDAMRMFRWFIYGVYYYEATSRYFRPNMYLDISDVFQKKLDYWASLDGKCQDTNLPQGCRLFSERLGRARGKEIDVSAAEAFHFEFPPPNKIADISDFCAYSLELSGEVVPI